VGVTFVVHGHFYQPPRENPWTEEVAREASAAPAHDWNERITEECYRPNGVARVVDERNRVLALVDNYQLLSFNVGPTLTSWLASRAPDVLERFTAGAPGVLAQAYGHIILPLATERDVRTQIRWGLADVRHRFGRDAAGMWLPECAASEEVLAILSEEGVAFTILAPSQIAAIRPLAGVGAWREVPAAPDARRPFRWQHPTRPGLGLDLVVYDGGLSNDVAFGLGRMGSGDLVSRAAAAGDGMVVVATDGETFGHHHRWGERGIAYALAVEARRQGVQAATLTSSLAANRGVYGGLRLPARRSAGRRPEVARPPAGRARSGARCPLRRRRPAGAAAPAGSVGRSRCLHRGAARRQDPRRVRSRARGR
jgi:alpha-amylase/alpha-mannosidase (GH57 family)